MAFVVGQNASVIYGAAELKKGGGFARRLAGVRSAPLPVKPIPTKEAEPEQPQGDRYYKPNVQNTFIHFKLGMDGEAISGPTMKRSATDPEAIMKAAFLLSTSNIYDVKPQKPVSDTSTVVSGGIETTDSEGGANSAEGLRESFASSSDQTVSVSNALHDLETFETYETYETHIPGPSWSAGAVGHASGQCKPCAWNWKPSGCWKGRTCTFCHMCADGEMKKQKKERQSRLRARKADIRNKKQQLPSVSEIPMPALRGC